MFTCNLFNFTMDSEIIDIHKYSEEEYDGVLDDTIHEIVGGFTLEE